ncbi:hypothetical protein PG993_008331 [Apiospora rasikravindrae]|uniref:Uncharacterized protein n=1 Tax=Apiospora rasikravindrae TaxID=990691 RepID=A0ABR1T1U8_9PEZI
MVHISEANLSPSLAPISVGLELPKTAKWIRGIHSKVVVSDGAFLSDTANGQRNSKGTQEDRPP